MSKHKKPRSCKSITKSYLKSRMICGGTGGVEGDVCHRSSLTHDEDLHGLWDLPPRQHRGVHHLPALEHKHIYISTWDLFLYAAIYNNICWFTITIQFCLNRLLKSLLCAELVWSVWWSMDLNLLKWCVLYCVLFVVWYLVWWYYWVNTKYEYGKYK